MEKTILVVAGKPLLYAVISQGTKNNIIVETLDSTKRRIAISARDRVTALNDITIYTETGDEPLLNVFAMLRDNTQSQPVTLLEQKPSDKEVHDFFATILPTYDKDRVYPNDIKKIIRWYNILLAAGITDFEEDKPKAADDATVA